MLSGYLNTLHHSVLAVDPTAIAQKTLSKMLRKSLQLFILVTCLSVSTGELIRNGDFEEPFGKDDWFCNGGCTLQRSEDAYTGVYSALVSNR